MTTETYDKLKMMAVVALARYVGSEIKKHPDRDRIIAVVEAHCTVLDAEKIVRDAWRAA